MAAEMPYSWAQTAFNVPSLPSFLNHCKTLQTPLHTMLLCHPLSIARQQLGGDPPPLCPVGTAHQGMAAAQDERGNPCGLEQRLMLPPLLLGSEEETLQQDHSPCSPASLVSLRSETCFYEDYNLWEVALPTLCVHLAGLPWCLFVLYSKKQLT